VQLSKC